MEPYTIEEIKKQFDHYTTAELHEHFTVHVFMSPFVVVTEKSTGKKGTMYFIHSPRLYFNFIED